MTVGQIMVICGSCLVVAAALLGVFGSILLHKKEKRRFFLKLNMNTAEKAGKEP